jgi:hypothetical protein
MTDESAAARRRFAALVTLAFALLTVPRLLLHELWRDEAWLWLVVTESHGLGELFSPLTRSGQGYLFPVLLYLASQISTSPLAMQLVHLLLAGAAVFVFARWAPLGLGERSLFLLGYFPFYEYAVISRHYVAGVLLVWCACAAARGRRPALAPLAPLALPALGAALGLLCQTTVYGAILAGAIAAGWLFDRWLRRAEAEPMRWPVAGAALALFLAGAYAGIAQLIPAPGTSFASGWTFGWDLQHAGKVLEMAWRAIVPLPRLAVAFWNTNLLDPWPRLEALAGAATLGLAMAVLWRRKVALLTFGVGAAGLLAFGYVKYIGNLRHQGHLWLLFVAALWLGGGLRERDSWRGRCLLVLLLVHALVGLFASAVDLRHPFSNGAAIAELIRYDGLEDQPLFGHREPPAATVSLALRRPLYAPSRRVYTTRPDWGPEQRELDPSEVRCAARELAQREGRDLFLVMTWELPGWQEVDAVGSRLGAIQPSEDYRLYRLRHERLTATAAAAGCDREMQPSVH